MTIAEDNDFNFINLLKAGLEPQIKKEITEIIIKEQMELFEKSLRNKVKDEVERLSFEKIDRMQDAMHLRDELRIFIKFSDEAGVRVNGNKNR